MKGEWADMFAAHDGLRSRIAELTEQAAGAEAALQVRRRLCEAFCCPARASVLSGPVRCRMRSGRRRRWSSASTWSAPSIATSCSANPRQSISSWPRLRACPVLRPGPCQRVHWEVPC